jgi:hypothetical protein
VYTQYDPTICSLGAGRFILSNVVTNCQMFSYNVYLQSLICILRKEKVGNIYVIIHYVAVYVAKYLILQHGFRIPSYQHARSSSHSLLSFCAMCMNYKCCFSLSTAIGWRNCKLRTTDSHDFTPKSVKLHHDVISYRTSLPSTVRILRVIYTRIYINPQYSIHSINSR